MDTHAMTPSNLNYNAPQDSPDRKGIAEAQKQTSLSNAELREAIKQIFKKRVDEAAKFMNPKFSYHGSYDADIDEILALFQAREQQLLTELRWQLPESSLEMVAEESEEYARGFDACSTEVFKVIEKYREGL